MAQYEKVFTKPYEDGYENLPSQNTPITAQTLNDKDTAIEHIEDFLDGQEFPTAEEKAAWNAKADISAIGTDESGRTTASKAYAIGEHFYKDGKFCTAKTAIASGATFTLNTNYVEGDISDYLKVVETTMTKSSANTWLTISNNYVERSGNHVSVQLTFNIADMPTVSGNVTLGTLPYTMKGFNKFGRLTDGSAPYTARSEGIFISSNSKDLKLCAQLPNGIYYLAIDYITNDTL